MEGARAGPPLGRPLRCEQGGALGAQHWEEPADVGLVEPALLRPRGCDETAEGCGRQQEPRAHATYLPALRTVTRLFMALRQPSAKAFGWTVTPSSGQGRLPFTAIIDPPGVRSAFLPVLCS